MPKAHGIEMQSGDVHYVVGAKEIYRALTGDMDANPPKARRWLRERGVPVSFLPESVDKLAIAVEKP